MDALSLLLSFRWPTDATGYRILDPDDGLPPYYLLTQRLREQGIIREPNWTKEDCLARLEEVPVAEPVSQTPFSGYFLRQIADQLRLQQEFVDRTKNNTGQLGETVQTTFARAEDAHLQQQLHMMQAECLRRSDSQSA
jgi:hypothetical protein